MAKNLYSCQCCCGHSKIRYAACPDMIVFRFSPADKTSFFQYDSGWLVLKSHLTKDGECMLSAQCVSLEELEKEIQRRKEELDTALAEARRKFGQKENTTGKQNSDGRNLKFVRGV